MTGPQYAVHKERRETSHLLHLVLTVLTAGMWGLFVWLPLTFWHKAGPRKRTTTKFH
jgi:hypothetical protein